MNRSFLGAAAAAALLAVSSAAESSGPGFWQTATQADFLKGEIEHLSIDEHGRLMLGPEIDKVFDGDVPFVWSLLAMADGSVLLGTGNDGKVLRVDRAGKGSVFFDTAEMEVHALASGPAGAVFVATSPDGAIYKVDAQGRGTKFFDPDDKYIWSLAVDRQGVLFAATGDKGIVYRITPEGQGARFFSTKAAHAVSLAFDASGQLLVGTGSPGRVFRVDTAGKGFLLLDTPYSEIHALRLDLKGAIYAAAQNARASQGADDRQELTLPTQVTPAVPSVSTEITSISVIDVPVTPGSGTTQNTRDDRRGPLGALYCIQPDGLWDQVWESREDAPYDVSPGADGSLLLATGPKGKLFRLHGNPVRAELLTRVGSQQATMIARQANRTYIATANPGLLMSVSASQATRGTFESEVKDARLVSSWGMLTWRASVPAGAQVELSSRSGNTRTPDETWSEWSPAYAQASGSPISSPKARYLQWRAVLTAKAESPVLTSVSSAYLPRNARPEVTSITVHPPGVVFQKPFSSGDAEIAGLDDDANSRPAGGAGGSGSAGGPALGRRTYQKGLQTFVWKAEDDNGDELVYDVSYRHEGDTTWHLLKSGLKDTLLVWDTSSVPNGTYVLKVVASDARANSVETTLTGEMESSSFDIDTMPPAVVVGVVRRDGQRFVVAVDIKDADSAIARVEYSLDAQRWQSAFPRDGILDGRTESFDIRLDADAAGRTFVVRATDALGNVGSGQIVVRETVR